MTNKRTTKPRRFLTRMAQDHADKLMLRTRSAVGFLNGTSASESAKMAAFLDLFHPTLDNERRVVLMLEAKAADTRRRA